MKALSSMATRHLLRDLAALASTRGLGPVEIESTGGVDAARRVAAGEPVDLVILADDAVRQLVRDGRVDETTLSPLALSDVAIAEASGTEGPAAAPTAAAFPRAEDLRAALLEARCIGYSTGPSGRALIDLIEEWGLMPQVSGRLMQAPSGVPVARLLRQGDIDLGFQQASELIGEPGVRILGVMPDECAIVTTFTGAVAVASADPDAAKAMLAFLTSTSASPLKRAHGFRTSEARRGHAVGDR